MMSETVTSLDSILAQRETAAGVSASLDEPTLKVVIVSLGDQWYGFRGDSIQEVLAECPVFFLPGCPKSLEGVMNVGGDIESVLRLQLLLGSNPGPAKAQSRILLGRTETMRSGIRVDSVEDVCDIPEASIQKPPHTLPQQLQSIVSGVFEFQGHPVHLLNLQRLFEQYRAGLE